MNYEPNRIDWAVGDLVIHDDDAKTAEMLMRVVKIGLPNRQIMTEYVNISGNRAQYLNRKNVFHDPARFGIVDGEPTRAGYRERPKGEATLGDF